MTTATDGVIAYVVAACRKRPNSQLDVKLNRMRGTFDAVAVKALRRAACEWEERAESGTLDLTYGRQVAAILRLITEPVGDECRWPTSLER